MSEFQLTHVALVGARMTVFQPYGFNARSELSQRRVVPTQVPEAGDVGTVREQYRAELPVWVHNIIADPDFPARHKYLMSLRRFEGELRDSKTDDVVSAVLSAGFRNQTLDPLNLPAAMPLRQRCALVMHIGVWQDAYRELEESLLTLLCEHREDVERWCRHASEAGFAIID